MRRASSVVVTVIVSAIVFGCGGSKGRVGGGADAAGGDATAKAAAELVENLDETAMGPSGKFGTIGYRGGPKESMVIDDCNQCSGAWSEEVIKENGGYGFRPDDPPVKEKVAANPEVGAVPLAVPTWCGRYSGAVKAARMRLEYDPVTKLGDADAMVYHLRDIAWMGCDRMKYAPRQRQVVNLLQAWLNVAKMKFERVVPILEVLASSPGGQFDTNVGKSGDASVDALVNGCRPLDPSYRPSGVHAALDKLDILEGAGKLTELDRAALTCQGMAGPFAILDIKRLDLDKAHDELMLRITTKQVPQQEGEDALLGLLNYRLVQPRMLDATSTAPEIRRLHTPTTKKAEEAYLNWHKSVGEPNKEVLRKAFEALARARGPMDGAKGCSADTRPLFEKMVKAKGSAKRADLDSLLSDPVGSVVFQADALCNAIDNPLLGAAEVDVIRRDASWLGPRRAAYMASLVPADASKELASVMTRSSKDDFAFRPINKQYPDKVGAKVYEVKSVVAKGEDLVVTAVVAKWTDPTYSCVSTNKIKSIRLDGYIEYEEQCFETGSEALKMEYAPMLIPKEFAGLVVKGSIVAMMLEDEPDKHAFVSSAGSAALKADPVKAYPMVVYPNSKAGTAVSSFFGVKLP